MKIQTRPTLRKNTLIIAAIIVAIPFILQARELSIDQVKQNVINLHKKVMDGQPAITPKEFKKIIGDKEEFVLLDVRSEAEFNAAHLPSVLNIERGRLEWIVPNIIQKPERTIYVYCQDGRRSGFATERLIQMGHTNAIHIADGFEGWVKDGNFVYNMHGQFILSTEGYHKRVPMVGNNSK